MLGTIIILILELTLLTYREAKVFAESEINPDTSCSRGRCPSVRNKPQGKEKCCHLFSNTQRSFRTQPQHSDSILESVLGQNKSCLLILSLDRKKVSWHWPLQWPQVIHFPLCLNINSELANLPTTAPKELLLGPSELRSWDILKCRLYTGFPKYEDWGSSEERSSHFMKQSDLTHSVCTVL